MFMKFITPSALLMLASQTSAEPQITCAKDTVCYQQVQQFARMQLAKQDSSFSAFADKENNVVKPIDCGSDECYEIAATKISQVLNFREMTPMDAFMPPENVLIAEDTALQYTALQPGQAFPMGRSTTLQNVLQGSVAHLGNYGCWCRNDGRAGRGDPKDEFDKACKVYWLASKCLDREYRLTAQQAESEGTVTPLDKEKCVVADQTYMVTTSFKDGLVIICKDPVNTCEYKACTIDIQDINHYWSIREQNEAYDLTTYSHANNNFDVQTDCPVDEHFGVGAGTGAGTEACCGAWPFIRFYRYSNPNLKCCEWTEAETTLSYGYPVKHGGLFNPNGQCCGTNGVADIGDEGCTSDNDN